MRIEFQGGLGDALMVQPFLKALAKYEEIYIDTKYPELFQHLDNIFISKEGTEKQELHRKEKLFWFLGRPKNAFEQLRDHVRTFYSVNHALFYEIDQIKLELDLPNMGLEEDKFLDELLNSIHRIKKPICKNICIIKSPYVPKYISNENMYYENYAGDLKELQDFIDVNKEKYYFISTGKNTEYTEKLNGVDLDLENKLSLIGFLYLCKFADTIVSQLGHLVPIACFFKKKLKVVKSNSDRPNSYDNRFKAAIISGECELI